MSVDKFGLHLNQIKRFKKGSSFTDCALSNTKDGELDAKNKIIKNIKLPVDPYDSATKDYVDSSIHNCLQKINSLEIRLIEIIEQIDRVIQTKKPKK